MGPTFELSSNEAGSARRSSVGLAGDRAVVGSAGSRRFGSGHRRGGPGSMLRSVGTLIHDSF